MALIRFGAVVSEARGSLSGTTFSRNKGGPYMRTRATPVNPQTSFQTQIREFMAVLADQWTTDLTAEDRFGWLVYGQSFPVKNKLGEDIVLSGIASYQRVNLPLLRAGLQRLVLAPTDRDVNGFLTGSSVFDVGMVQVAEFSFTSSGGALGEVVQIKATPPLSGGRTFIKDRLRLIFTSAADPLSPVDFLAAWLARFGNLPVLNNLIGLIATRLNPANGASSAEFRADAIVINTP